MTLNRTILTTLALGFSLATVLAQTNSLQLPPGSVASNSVRAEAHNPVIWADVPDISVMRVGKTYYMSSTTMHMSLGLPIMKSTDLVNWRMASYAYDMRLLSIQAPGGSHRRFAGDADSSQNC